uniref:Uncharacterized protein n=1 Tax=Rhizophora mucronata TaxID=61149 RepID=A0A2P2Q7K5_RHIMU
MMKTRTETTGKPKTI